MTEVSKAEILEEMCLLVTARHTIRPAVPLSDAEKTLLRQKALRGSSVFPISNTEKGEGIKHWLSDPFTRVLVQSLSVDCATMEGLLRKVFQDSYTIYYEIAKGKARSTRERIEEHMRALGEAKKILKQGSIDDYERLDWICSILDKAMFHPDSVYLSWNLKKLRENRSRVREGEP